MPPLLGRVTRADSLNSNLSYDSNTSTARLGGESAAERRGLGAGAARGTAVRGGSDAFSPVE